MRIVMTLVIAAAFLAVGCGEDDDCSTNSDCKYNETCEKGLCVSIARIDASTEPTECGDDVCEPGEGCTSCPQDCGDCYQLKCGDGECSDSVCETCATCPEDCGQCEQTECGNGVCEPGEDIQCSDCASLQSSTCDQNCTSHCDCKQPWTACGVGVYPVCSPVECRDCYDRGEMCCWCPAESCSNVSCVGFDEECPSC